jgi:hypothetical protein
MLSTVTGARGCLVALGSRSRDARYLGAIEEVLARHPALVCYRVLFGPPRHQVLKDHLARLVELRDPADRSLGVKTLHIGMVEDTDSSPERFFCASEQMAVVPIPSLTSHEAFDSGVVYGPAAAARLVDHGRLRHDRGSNHRHVAGRCRGCRRRGEADPRAGAGTQPRRHRLL